MTKPKKSGKASPKKRKPKNSEDGLFPGKSEEEIMAALLQVPPKKSIGRNKE